MLKIKSSHVYILFTIIFISCKPSGNVDLPKSTGKPGSLVIVSDTSIQRMLKGNLESVFLHPRQNTSEGEPFFEILNPDISEFLKLFYNQKTVLVLVTESNFKDMEELMSPFSNEAIHSLINDPKSGLISKKDVMAKSQHIAYLFGRNAEELKTKLQINHISIVNALLESELKDWNEDLFKDTGNNQYYAIFKSKYGVGVHIPASFKLTNETENFYRFEMNTTESGAPETIGLMIYAYPYKDTSDFSYVNIRSVRDTFCKHHIPGELPGTYMGTTESSHYPARTRTMIELSGYETCKIKGWWTIRGLSMAGPFMRYVVFVPEGKLLFVFEGFIYRPDLNLKERDLRLIEGMALSIK